MNKKTEYQEIIDLKNAMENKTYDTFKNLFEVIVKDEDKLNALTKDKYFNERLKYFIFLMYLKDGYKSFIFSTTTLERIFKIIKNSIRKRIFNCSKRKKL